MSDDPNTPEVTERIDSDGAPPEEIGLPADAASHSEATPPTEVSATDALEWTVGRTIAGKYVIRSPLGTGATGSVYLCEHALLPGSRLAVKLLRPELCRDADQRERFLMEGKLLLGLQHPNLIGVRDLGETSDGQIYLCLDFCEGVSLTELLQRRGPLPPEDAFDLTLQLLAGLDIAHRAGIVHRDLKPDHLVIGVGDDDRLTVRILDFGIATIDDDRDDDLSRRFLIGTPRYMSPEQAWGHPIDARSDLYSVGLLLQEMLTGLKAVQGQGTEELLRRQRLAQVSRLRDQMSPHPWRADIERLLRRVLTRTPERRVATAVEFQQLIEAIRSGRARPRHSGRRWGAAVVTMASLAFAVSAGVWFFDDARPANAIRRGGASTSEQQTPAATRAERWPYQCPLCGYEAEKRRICPIDGVRLKKRQR